MFLVPSFAFSGWRAWIPTAPSYATITETEVIGAPDSKKIETWSFLAPVTILLSTILVLPLCARFIWPLAPTAYLRSSGSGFMLTLDLRRASWIELSTEDAPQNRPPRSLSVDKFRGGINGMFKDFYPKQAESLSLIAHPMVILASPGSTNTAFLAIDGNHFSRNTRIISVFGHEHFGDPDYSPYFLEDSLLKFSTDK
jgi:hypothetical protein